MNVGKFVGVGREEAKNVEGNQVQVSAICYLAEGNTIAESFTVGPKGQGVLDSYLVGSLVYSWVVDVDGSASLAKPEPKPKPKPKPKRKPKPKPKPKPVPPPPIPVQPR